MHEPLSSQVKHTLIYAYRDLRACRPPMFSIVSPEDVKKLRQAWVHVEQGRLAVGQQWLGNVVALRSRLPVTVTAGPNAAWGVGERGDQVPHAAVRSCALSWSQTLHCGRRPLLTYRSCCMCIPTAIAGRCSWSTLLSLWHSWGAHWQSF